MCADGTGNEESWKEGLVKCWGRSGYIIIIIEMNSTKVQNPQHYGGAHSA